MKYFTVILLLALVGKLAAASTPPFPPRNHYRVEERDRLRDDDSAEDSEEADIQDDEGSEEEPEDDLTHDFPPPPQNQGEGGPQFDHGGPPVYEQEQQQQQLPSSLSWRGIYEKYWPWADTKQNELHNNAAPHTETGPPNPNPTTSNNGRFRASFRDDEDSDEEEDDEEEFDDSIVESDIQYGPYRDGQGQSSFRAAPFFYGSGRSGSGPVVVRRSEVKNNRVTSNRVRVPVYNNYNTMPYNHRAQVSYGGSRRVVHTPMVYNRRVQMQSYAPVRYVQMSRPVMGYRPNTYKPQRQEVRRQYTYVQVRNPNNRAPMQYYSNRPVSGMRQRSF